MLDVHAPHERIHGLTDFFLHLFTITVGLLIALSLEGCVEWQHHRHLVQEAEEGLRNEIRQNSQSIGQLRQRIADQRTELDADLKTLSQIEAHPGMAHERLSFTFRMQSFDDVTWKTAQTTGAFGFMPYQEARTYSDIYSTQDQVFQAQQSVVEDVMRSASLIVTQPDNSKLRPEQIDNIRDRIGMVEMRLVLLQSLVDALDKTYTKFQSQHA